MLEPHGYSLQKFPHLPALVQLFLSLQKVPAVGPEESFLVRNECDGIGA